MIPNALFAALFCNVLFLSPLTSAAASPMVRDVLQLVNDFSVCNSSGKFICEIGNV